jgi:hypothetical protein
MWLCICGTPVCITSDPGLGVPRPRFGSPPGPDWGSQGTPRWHPTTPVWESRGTPVWEVDTVILLESKLMCTMPLNHSIRNKICNHLISYLTYSNTTGYKNDFHIDRPTWHLCRRSPHRLYRSGRSTTLPLVFYILWLFFCCYIFVGVNTKQDKCT